MTLSLCVSSSRSIFGNLTCRAKGRDQRDRFRPAADPRSCCPPRFCGCSRTPRRTYNAPMPFGAYILCAESESRSQPISSTSTFIFPAGLDRVGMEPDLLAPTLQITNKPPDLVDRLDRADLVVSKHDRDQNRVVADRRLYIVEPDDPIFVNRQIGYRKSLLFKIFADTLDGRMLDRGCDDVAVPVLSIRPPQGREPRDCSLRCRPM